MNHFLRSLRQDPWKWGVGLGLCLALVVTALARLYAVQAAREGAEARQAEVIESALTTVEQRFSSLRDGLHERARRVGTDSSVIRGLRSWHKEGRRSTSLSQSVVGLSSEARTSVEVYSQALELLAWTGEQMPLDSTHFGGGVPEQPQTTVVADDNGRRALAAWMPVQQGESLLGAVRVVRVIQYQPPVQNRYVQATSLEDRWSQVTGERIQVHWAFTRAPEPNRILRGVNGDFLGSVSVTPPSPSELVARTTSFYTDLLIGWLVLLMGWGLFLVARWYWQLVRREGLRRHPSARAAAAKRLAVLALLAVGARYALLLLDVPGRWVGPGTSLNPLFDPTYLASTIGAGLFRSIGDLLITGLWASGLGVGVVLLGRYYRPRAHTLSGLPDTFQEEGLRKPHVGRFLSTLVLFVAASLGGILAIAYVVRRAVLDSTLDFFSRTGLLPDPLVLGVLCGLFLLVAAAVHVGIGGGWVALHHVLRYRPERWPLGIGLVLGVLLLGGAVGALYRATDVQILVSMPYMLVAVAAVGIGILYGLISDEGGETVLTLRGLLGGVFAVTLLLYPLLYAGMDAKRQEHMVDAAQSFEQGQDPRVLYSIQQVLQSASEALVPLLGDSPTSDVRIDSVATQLVRQSLLASVSTYEVRLSVLGGEGSVRRQYTTSGRIRRAPSDRAARAAFATLRPLYELRGGPVIEQLPRSATVRPSDRSRFQYAGLLGLPPADDSIETWVLVRIEPQSLLPGTGFGVPRVLLPDGSYGDLYADLSLAEFRGRTLVRSVGHDFGRTRLHRDELDVLNRQTSVWRESVIRGRRMLTYYHRSPTADESPPSIVAVRIPAILAFDHLYYLVRLTVAGLCIGLVVYLLGLYVRFHRGRLPAPRVRFRNKVLNAFLVVGIVSMAAVGVVGVRVVTGENERVIERRIRDQLTRVEETLALEAGSDDRLWQVAERMDVDSLAARVGLDLHLYQDGQLTHTSQPRLLRDGLIDGRLPGDVYHALHAEGYRFVIDEAAIGQFRYRVGYKALVDDEGQPRLVVGAPTLAQQEQLQEEQSRTLAYLFGALLLLVVVVILTGVVLANALAQPIAQLREGLEAVGKGQFARTLTVDTRDEIGDLVRTFNEMREQLAESRRKLAQQERELAWREMARQVAHEIKNPLTPMKLSIQHLRRAYERADDATDSSKFAEVFDRITSTLIEQVEALVRIADEFSTFARLPTRVPEPIDLNEVIREAASLMEEESTDHTAIDLELGDEPLVVEADREELRRIYINLLKNAFQSIPEERDGRVRVTTRRVDGADGDSTQVESRIADNGTGIPPDLRDKIFEPNFSTKTSGTGLGLAIAKKSLSELDGEIGFETTEGEGTTFWVRLPEEGGS